VEIGLNSRSGTEFNSFPSCRKSAPETSVLAGYLSPVSRFLPFLHGFHNLSTVIVEEDGSAEWKSHRSRDSSAQLLSQFIDEPV
jgi:hypothetical protein